MTWKRAIRVLAIAAGIALILISLRAVWHFIAPSRAAIIIFAAGLLLFFGIRGFRP
jgi:hypothetical protein